MFWKLWFLQDLIQFLCLSFNVLLLLTMQQAKYLLFYAIIDFSFVYSLLIIWDTIPFCIKWQMTTGLLEFWMHFIISLNYLHFMFLHSYAADRKKLHSLRVNVKDRLEHSLEEWIRLYTSFFVQIFYFNINANLFKWNAQTRIFLPITLMIVAL